MAREDIQLNMVAPQDNTVAPADVYSRPYWDRNAGSGFMELAKSLGILGDTIAAKQRRDQQGQDQAYYANYQALSAEFDNPDQKNAGIITNKGIGLFDLFSTGKSGATVRNRVEEVQGDTAASTDFYSEKGYGSRLFAVANDPAALQAEIKKIRAEAYTKVKGRPAFGDSYIKQIDTFLNGFSAKAYEQQANQYRENEKLHIAKEAAGSATPDPAPNVDLNDHVAGASNSLLSYLSKGKPESYISSLQPKMSDAMARMIAAAPPEVRQRIRIESGARTPQRQAELIQAKLSKGDAQNFSKYVSELGPEKGAAAWAAAYPKAAASRGIGKMIALPGRSLHQHGYAIDLARDPVAEAWLHKNAGKFGLYYPMSYEPWHIELIGGRAARRNYSGIQSTEGSQEPATFGPFKPDMNTAYRGYDNSPNFFENYYKVMNGVENATGDPYATNPKSSAYGHSQFIDSTWIEQYHKAFPDSNLPDEEILAARSNKEIDKKIAIQYAKENAKTLEAYAIPVNTTTLLMAHQMGAKGAAMVLQAFKEDASQPIESVLSADAIAANPQWQGRTVAQVYADAAGKTGEFTNPVGGQKERTTTAYLEGLHSSPLGPVEYTKSFAEAIIDKANATNSPEVLDAMPNEILALPEYASKVQATREKIMTERRTQFTFAQAQKEKAEKDFTEKVLGEFAAKIIDDPTVPIPDEVQKEIAKLPGGGFEVLTKLDTMRKARIAPTPESKRADAIKIGEATAALEKFKMGELSIDQAKAAAMKIDDPEKLATALQAIEQFKFVPLAVTDPGVKEMKAMFLNMKYKYIENTTIPDPQAAANGLMAATLYNRYLSVELAKLGHKATDIELYEKDGIIQRVQDRVLNEVDPPLAEGIGNVTGNKANAPTEPQTPVQPAVTPQGVLTPEQKLLLNNLDQSNKFIGVGPR